jgi:predicted ArsR family transcriptional regulator
MAAYPDSPGHKTGGTSRAAARRIAPRATALRDRIYAFLQANYPASFTADEVADRLGVSILSARPRMSELHCSELIEPTGERRLNASGMFASCWRAVRPSMKALVQDALNERAQ